MNRRVEYRGVSWDVEDPQTEDWPFWDLWEAGEFEPETIEIIDRFVTPGSTFIDIGAWDGPFSLWAAQTAGRVLAVEPDPVAVRRLRYNVAANHLSNVTVIDAALNDYVGTCYIEAPEDVGWGVCTTHLADEGMTVRCMTMQHLFETNDVRRAALVKMDVEGAETIVLEHSASFLASTGTPLLVSMHGCVGLDDRDFDFSWFDGFSEWSLVDDHETDAWKSVLALP